jgi:hypothetical protein
MPLGGPAGRLLERPKLMRLTRASMLIVIACAGAGACAIVRAPTTESPSRSEAARYKVIARAQVWTRTNVPAMIVRVGPRGPGAFAPGASVACTYVDKELEGKSPKFLCRIGNSDQVLVKYGRTNGEVFGEVLATRLLWALGFGAERVYPVRIVCKECPAALDAGARSGETTRIEYAAIKRRSVWLELKLDDDKEGWSWDELDWADPEFGGAPRAHRDALKLLAVLLQHGDNKSAQQRILRRDAGAVGTAESCRRPFLMISDLGLTFGKSNRLNANREGSVNLAAWRRPIWKGEQGCTGNLSKSFTGTLADPVISEDGRRFVAARLAQPTDRQLEDLFTIARVTRRENPSTQDDREQGTLQDWIETLPEQAGANHPASLRVTAYGPMGPTSSHVH